MGKQIGKHTFEGEGFVAECRSERTRYGFRHLATVFISGGGGVVNVKACYYNRTWERFEYESVLLKAAERMGKAGEAVREFCKKYREPNRLAPTACVMSLLGLLAKDQAEANAAQTRILKTVPGIDLPDDWDGLPEDVKAARLAGVVKVMKEGPGE